MRIVNARPAPLYIRLPVQIVAAFAGGAIGKGELATAALLYTYLWGHQKPLEGTTQEFSDVLGIEIRVIQRHLPALGSTGGVLCIRPQRGHWTVSDPISSPALPSRRQGNETTFLSSPVVVVDSPDLGSNHSQPKQQQHLSRNAAGEASKLSLETSKMTLQQQDALGDLLQLHVARDVALQLVLDHDPHRVRDIARAAQRAENPAGWARDALTHDWHVPPGGDRPRNPADYISGEYADLIEH